MRGACHCGAVSINVPASPDYLNQCNCTLCTKLGALWGYYSPDQVEIEGARRAYQRADADPPTIIAHFCEQCGATIDWSPVDPASHRMGVNMRLFEPADLHGVEVRYGDRRSGGTAPRRYYRSPTVFGDDGTAA